MIVLSSSVEVGRFEIERGEPADALPPLVVTLDATVYGKLGGPLPGPYDGVATVPIEPYVEQVTIRVHDDLNETSGHIKIDRSMLGDLVDIVSKLDAALPADINGDPKPARPAGPHHVETFHDAARGYGWQCFTDGCREEAVGLIYMADAEEAADQHRTNNTEES